MYRARTFATRRTACRRHLGSPVRRPWFIGPRLSLDDGLRHTSWTLGRSFPHSLLDVPYTLPNFFCPRPSVSLPVKFFLKVFALLSTPPSRIWTSRISAIYHLSCTPARLTHVSRYACFQSHNSQYLRMSYDRPPIQSQNVFIFILVLSCLSIQLALCCSSLSHGVLVSWLQFTFIVSFLGFSPPVISPLLNTLIRFSIQTLCFRLCNCSYSLGLYLDWCSYVVTISWAFFVAWCNSSLLAPLLPARKGSWKGYNQVEKWCWIFK